MIIGEGSDTMDDKQIIKDLFCRAERGIESLAHRFGKQLYRMARNICESDRDAEECVNDAYLRAWQSIPPTVPKSLGAYLSKITRNLAIDKYHSRKAEKRNSSGDVAFLELEAVLPDESESPDDEVIMKDCINSFLYSLDKEKRIIFVQRYFYMCSLEEIAKENGIKMINLKVQLYRLREKLKKHLKHYGFEYDGKNECEEVKNEKE